MTLYLILTGLLVAIFFFGLISQGAQALLEPKTDELLYSESDVVAVGAVRETSVLEDLDATKYTVAVERYNKGGELVDRSTSLEIIGKGVEGDDIIEFDNPLFRVGDRAIFYLDHDGESLRISPYSRILGDEDPAQLGVSALTIGILGAAVTVALGIGILLLRNRKSTKPLV